MLVVLNSIICICECVAFCHYLEWAIWAIVRVSDKLLWCIGQATMSRLVTCARFPIFLWPAPAERQMNDPWLSSGSAALIVQCVARYWLWSSCYDSVEHRASIAWRLRCELLGSISRWGCQLLTWHTHQTSILCSYFICFTFSLFTLAPILHQFHSWISKTDGEHCSLVFSFCFK